jgi:peroxiredoxin Q/BCP
VILYFYPKDNTSGCTLEALDFTAARDEFAKLGAEILAVSPDSPESHCRFADKHNLGITLLSDTDHVVLKQYGVWQQKKLYGREFWGVVRSTFLIDPRGDLRHEWRKVKVKDHVDAVKAKLIELQQG